MAALRICSLSLPLAADFSTYQLLRRWLHGKAPDPSHAEAPQRRGLLAALADATSAVVCGGLAGMVMWVVVLPLDTAKTRIQTAYPGSAADVGVLRQLGTLRREGERKGTRRTAVVRGAASAECLTRRRLCSMHNPAAMKSPNHHSRVPPPLPCVSAGGFGALYAGLTPTLVRAFPANAAQWLAWELCMQQARSWGLSS